MNLEDAVRRLNGYLQRRGTVDGSGGWTDQYLLDLINDSNLDMYHRIVNYGPDIFHTTTRFTYTANSESVDIRVNLGERPSAIWYSGTLTQDAAVGPNNIPLPIQMSRRTSLDNGRGGAFALNSSTLTQGPAAVSFMLPVSSGASALYEGYVLGDDFLLRPIPTVDVFVYMRWTPVQPATITDPIDELLMGQLPQFHPAIVYRSAISAKSANTTQLERLYMEVVGQFDANLKMGCRQRQRQQPPQRESMRWEY
jgi:hypothetical protein